MAYTDLDKRRAKARETTQKRKEFADQFFGTQCFVCSNEGGRMPLHRKDGQPHKRFTLGGLSSFKYHILEHGNEYVRLCYRCHKAVHWAMDYLDMTWDDIHSRQIDSPD